MNNVINDILDLAKQYKKTIKSCEIKGRCCYINSYGDNEWYFRLDDIVSGERINLYHLNGTKKGEGKYHKQRDYRNIEQLFHSIGTHEVHNYIKAQRKPKMERLFDQLHNPPKIKIV